MKYIEYEISNQIDFTHPYMTISQMKKMLKSNCQQPRDYYLYDNSPEEMISNLEKQYYTAFPGGVNEDDLRLPVLVFPIPTGEMWNPVKYGFILKLEANGTSYVYYPENDKELEQNSNNFSS